MAEVILTWKEMTVLAFVCKFHGDRGYSPTYDDIAKGTGFRSKSLIRFYLKKLERAGKISIEPNVARSIVVLEGV